MCEFLTILVSQVRCASSPDERASGESRYQSEHDTEDDADELGNCYAGHDQDSNECTQQSRHSMQIMDSTGVNDLEASLKCRLNEHKPDDTDSSGKQADPKSTGR